MRKGASELKDLDVDRVDGVDKPATGRHFLLFKKEDGDVVMKGYGALATVAHELLEKARVDKQLSVSLKSAIAFNGLAQVLGEDPVFVGKSVPTQPYEFSEPDVDKRGPADEDLGGNFTPRSMPGSMVGSVSFRMKDEAAGEATQTSKAWPPAKDDEDMPKKKASAKAKADDGDSDADDDEMDASEKENRGVARRMDKMEGAITKLAETVEKAISGEVKKVRKAQDDEDDEPRRVEKARPRSRQVEDDDEPVRRVRKSDYEPRFGVSFADVAFGK